MKLLHFLKSRPVIIVLAIAVNITGIDVHSSSSNLPIGKSTITQSQLQIQREQRDFVKSDQKQAIAKNDI